MIAEVHGKSITEVNQNYVYNKERFAVGLDVITLNSSDLKDIGYRSGRPAKVFTESAYLKLVKTFSDDRAWQVQGQLI